MTLGRNIRGTGRSDEREEPSRKGRVEFRVEEGLREGHVMRVNLRVKGYDCSI